MARQVQKTRVMHNRMHRAADAVGDFMVDAFNYLALFAIGAAIVWSAAWAFISMKAAGGAAIEDILLLFIYLELGAMVGIYFKTNHMPTRFLIYVGITALVRMLLIDIQETHKPDMGIIYISASILLLAVANLVIRYGSARLPSPEPAVRGRGSEVMNE